MGRILIFSFGVAMLVAVVGCKNEDSMKMDGDKAAASTMPAKYTCTMHPEVVSDMQGKCLGRQEVGFSFII